MLRNHLHRIVLILMFVVIYLGNLHWEHIPVNNGFGWDGKHYAALSIHFEDMVSQKLVDSYQYQRIITPAIVYYACKWIGIPLTEATVLAVYGYYNLVIILIGVLLFWGWCNRLNVSKPIEIAGFSALFFNYFILKNTPYYPILTDPTAFFFGILLMYWITKHQTIGLWFTVAIGAFVFPLFHLVTLPLATFSERNRVVSWLQSKRVFSALKGLSFIVFTAASVGVVLTPNLLLPAKYQMNFSPMLLPIAFVCAMLYLQLIFRLFQYQNNQLQPKAFQRFPVLPFMAVVLFWILTKYIVLQNSIPEDGFTPMVFSLNVVQQIIDFPFAWMIAHLTYFGPAVAVLLLWGRTLFYQLFKQSDGIILFAFISILLMMGSESRQFIYMWPFWVWLLLPLLSTLRIDLSQAIAFSLLCILQSKCWLPINVVGNFADYDYSAFPEQRYFMNHGPYMSNASYLINTIAGVLTLTFTWLIFYHPFETKNTDHPLASETQTYI